MDPESEDIQSHNILVEYRKRPRCLEKSCLADFAIWQCKTKGKQMKVKDILNDTERQLLVNHDEGFYIFKTLRNSPVYFDRKMKDAFSMIRQLGFPTLFVSQSAAETKWPELLQALGKM